MKVFSLKKNNILISEKLNLRRDNSSFSWIRLVSPEKDEIEQIALSADVDDDFIFEFFEEDERPRIIKSANYLMIIYRSPIMQDDYIITAPVGFIITKKAIITLEKASVFVLEAIEKNFEENRLKKLLSKDSFYFFNYVIDKINDEFTRYVKHVENNAELFRAKISDLSEKHTENLYKSSVTSSFFQQALTANLEVLSSLRTISHPFIKKKTRDVFDNLYYDVLQIFDTHKIQKELITSLFDFQSIVQSTKMNISVKKLTSLAFLVMIPTLVTGIYGMNFKYMFLTRHPHGFIITIIFMIVISVILWLVFRAFDLI